jgi:hypothetical protein
MHIAHNFKTDGTNPSGGTSITQVAELQRHSRTARREKAGIEGTHKEDPQAQTN